MKEKLLEILNSGAFKKKLNDININYPNLKQENVIRNSILELLNSNFQKSNPSLKTFAEHPRDKSSRVDLSIINEHELLNPFLIEFKFQYTNDFKQFLDYERFVERDFQRIVCNKQSDLFILIISHWDKTDKHAFDKKWGLTSNLSRFLSLEETWKKNIGNLLCKFENTELQELKIEVPQPYKTTYDFFIISRKMVSL